MVQAGRLRHRITIEQQTQTRDALGGPIQTWTHFAEVWADVSHLSSRELSRVRMFSSEITTKFVIRYIEGVTNTMRIQYGSAVYTIAEVLQPENDRRSLELLGYAEVQPS